MIRWTVLAPWEFEFSFPCSLTSGQGGRRSPRLGWGRPGRAESRADPRCNHTHTLRTRHTLEPLAWYWSHWPGRLSRTFQTHSVPGRAESGADPRCNPTHTAPRGQLTAFPEPPLRSTRDCTRDCTCYQSIFGPSCAESLLPVKGVKSGGSAM